MRRRKTDESDSSEGMLITRASGRGRRLFTGRQSRWARVLILAACLVAALCLLVGLTSDQDPFGAFARGCTAVFGVAFATALILRLLVGRTR